MPLISAPMTNADSDSGPVVNHRRPLSCWAIGIDRAGWLQVCPAQVLRGLLMVGVLLWGWGFLVLPVRAESLTDLQRLFRNTVCRHCDLSYANLAGVNLSDAYLGDTDLVGTDLQGALLDRANLTRARAIGAERFNLTAALPRC